MHADCRSQIGQGESVRVLRGGQRRARESDRDDQPGNCCYSDYSPTHVSSL